MVGKNSNENLRFNQFFTAFKSMFSNIKSEDETPFKAVKKLKASIESAKVILQDPTQSQFVMCMIAEDMAIYETARLLEGLTEYGIPSRNIIVNQLIQVQEICTFCTNRRRMQQLHLKDIKSIYQKRFSIVEIPLFDKESLNTNVLQEYMGFLFKLQEKSV